jgi:hypothetical protein
MARIDTLSVAPRLTEEQRAFSLVYIPPIAIILTVFLFIDGGSLNEWLQPFTIFYSVSLLIWLKPELTEIALKKPSVYLAELLPFSSWGTHLYIPPLMRK